MQTGASQCSALAPHARITLTHGQPPFGLFVGELVLDDEPIGCD